MKNALVFVTLVVMLSTSSCGPIGAVKSQVDTNIASSSKTLSVSSNNKNLNGTESNAKKMPSMGMEPSKKIGESGNVQKKSGETENKYGSANNTNEKGKKLECNSCNEMKGGNDNIYGGPQTSSNGHEKYNSIMDSESFSFPASDMTTPGDFSENVTKKPEEEESIGILLPFNKKRIESILMPLLPESVITKPIGIDSDVEQKDTNMDDSITVVSKMDQERNSETSPDLDDAQKRPISSIEYHLGNPLALGLHFPLWPLKDMLNKVERVMSLMNLTKEIQRSESNVNVTKVKTVDINGRKYMLKANVFTPDGNSRFFVRLISLTPLVEESKHEEKEREDEDKIEHIILGSQEESLDSSEEKEPEGKPENLDKKKGKKSGDDDEDKEESDENTRMESKSEKTEKKKNEKKADGDSSDSDDEE